VITTPTGELGWAFLCCRLLALLFFVYSISLVVQMVVLGTYLSAAKGNFQMVWVSLVYASIAIASYLIPGIYLWLRADRISARLVSPSASFRSLLPTDLILITDLAFKIIGVWVFIESIPLTGGLVVTAMAEGVPRNFSAALIADLIKMTLALLLVLRTQGIIGLIHRVRSAGTHSTDS
jgi:hypothetical protein